MRILPVSVAVAGVLALAAAPQSQAQGDELSALKAQLEALQKQVADLEKQQETQQQVQQEAQDRTTDMLAKAKAGTPEWASRFTWKGDLRYRHENIDQEGATTDRDRQRIRARFGFAAKINDDVTGTLQLATGGGSNDPRSTNQTLGDGLDRKDVAIDLAYINWKAAQGLSLQLGKMPQPWQKVGSYFWDGDITPEGASLGYSSGAFFANAFGYWLQERSSASESTLTGAQLGFKGDLGAAKLTAAVGYFDVGAVQGASVLSGPFFEGSQGNTTVADLLAFDFNMVEVLAQVEFTAGAMPLVLFADYIQNQDADDLDTGYSAGITLGKAGNPGTWEFGYVYQSMEKDAQFGQFIDSDFGGGTTDSEGSVFKVGYAVAKNWVLNGTYFLNARNVDVGTEVDYDRYQLDLNYKF
jgi:type II secretory pathway pseudopilin PulG